MKKPIQYICAKISGYWLGFDIHNILEIVNPGLLGNKQAILQESMPYHGDSISIVSLSDYLLSNSVKYEASNRILISEINDRKAGLIVDSAEEIIRISPDEINPSIKFPAALNSDILDGIIETEEKQIYIFSIEKLYQLVFVE